ncbi:hypothetical protein H0H92_003686 [Tricholoma furcatifolium]|nr:hypothetical protein H0H92_003686 [Tricholoma furcatifolium]
MVALTSRFALLAAFVALASSPLSASAAVIPSSGKDSFAARSFDLAQRTFSLQQAKAAKRDYNDDYCTDELCVYLLDINTRVLKRGHRHDSPRWSLSRQRKHGRPSYSVSVRPSHFEHSKHRNGHIRRADTQAIGTIALINDSDKNDAGNALGHLVVDSNPISPDVYPVDASSDNSSDFTLVQQNQTSANEVIVQLQWLVNESNFECMGYNKSDATGQLFVSPCNATGPVQQSFLYNTDTNDLQPLPSTSDGSDSSAQSVMSRQDAGPAKDVVLRWEPKSQGANAEALVEISSTVAPTSTMTTTVTVTNTPTATPSAANFDAVSSGTPSLSATVTSTSAGVAPTGTRGVNGTAGAAGVLDVQVVQPSNGSSAMNATSTAFTSAAPTTTMNAQDVASSIAANSTITSTAPAVSSTSTGSVPSARALRF